VVAPDHARDDREQVRRVCRGGSVERQLHPSDLERGAGAKRGRTHAHGGERKDGVDGDRRRKDQEAHERCETASQSSGSSAAARRETRRTRDEEDEPDGVDRDLVGRKAREEAAVGHATVAREGVERARVGVRRRGDDLQGDTHHQHLSFEKGNKAERRGRTWNATKQMKAHRT